MRAVGAGLSLARLLSAAFRRHLPGSGQTRCAADALTPAGAVLGTSDDRLGHRVVEAIARL
jgi:hypothetical protein